MAPIDESRLIGEIAWTISAATGVLLVFIVLLATIIGCICNRKGKNNEGGSGVSNIADERTLSPPSPPRSPPSKKRKATKNQAKFKYEEPINPVEEAKLEHVEKKLANNDTNRRPSPSTRCENSITAMSGAMSVVLPEASSASISCQRLETGAERKPDPPIIEPRLPRQRTDNRGGRNAFDEAKFERDRVNLRNKSDHYYKPPLHYGIDRYDSAYQTLFNDLDFEKACGVEEPVPGSKSLSIALRAPKAEKNGEDAEEKEHEPDVVRSRSMVQG